MSTVQLGRAYRLAPVTLVLCLAGGCASLHQRIERLVQKERFAEALSLLEEADVGQDPSPDADAQALEARIMYARAVADHFRETAATEFAAGNARRAQEIINRGVELCPWSDDLAQAKAQRDRIVSELDSLVSELSRAFDDPPVTIQEAREALAPIESVETYIQDTPALVRYRSTARDAVEAHVATQIQRNGRNLDPGQLQSLTRDARLLCSDDPVIG